MKVTFVLLLTLTFSTMRAAAAQLSYHGGDLYRPTSAYDRQGSLVHGAGGGLGRYRGSGVAEGYQGGGGGRYGESSLSSSSYGQKGTEYQETDSKYYYGGQYKDSCRGDGLYYLDDTTFVMCSNGYPHQQSCPPGTKTGGSPTYKPGYYYGYTDLCSVNLVDYGLSPEHYVPIGHPPARQGGEEGGRRGGRESYGGTRLHAREHGDVSDGTSHGTTLFSSHHSLGGAADHRAFYHEEKAFTGKDSSRPTFGGRHETDYRKAVHADTTIHAATAVGRGGEDYSTRASGSGIYLTDNKFHNHVSHREPADFPHQAPGGGADAVGGRNAGYPVVSFPSSAHGTYSGTSYGGGVPSQASGTQVQYTGLNNPYVLVATGSNSHYPSLNSYSTKFNAVGSGSSHGSRHRSEDRHQGGSPVYYSYPQHSSIILA